MDDERFDALCRVWGTGTSRRRALGFLAGLAGLSLEDAVAKGGHAGKDHAKESHAGKDHT